MSSCEFLFRSVVERMKRDFVVVDIGGGGGDGMSHRHTHTLTHT